MKRDIITASLKIVSAASVAIGLVASQPAFAGFGIGGLSLPKAGTGSSSGILNQQTQLVRDFSGSQLEVLQAQGLLAKAFDDKTEAATLAADEQALSQGASASDIEKAMTDSSSVNAKIKAQMDKGEVLTAQGRQLYVQSLPHYATGLAKAVAMRPDFPKFLSGAESAIASASVMEKLSLRNKLSDGVYIAKNAPGYITNLQSTTSDILSYAKKENIPVPNNVTSLIPATP
jgi:hypothetical protein